MPWITIEPFVEPESLEHVGRDTPDRLPRREYSAFRQDQFPNTIRSPNTKFQLSRVWQMKLGSYLEILLQSLIHPLSHQEDSS